jgi:MFS family permease
VLSLGGVGIATAVFGLSKTIWQMIIFRCFAGVFAGTIVLVTVTCLVVEVLGADSGW